MRGRYVRGAGDASAHVVLFADYQCSECRDMEEQVETLLRQRDDVSVSIKHFPWCMECNRRTSGLDFHPNACRAARAAEAAGMLGGDASFWQMHEWLFERRGEFGDEELDVAVSGFGYEPARFRAVMDGEQTLQRVQSDIEEGAALELRNTPMIFVNGVHLRAWKVPDALARAVTAAAGPPPTRSAEAETRPARQPPPPTPAPPPATPEAQAAAFIERWRSQPVRRVPPGRTRSTIGPSDAAVQVVMWGDYREPLTAEASAILRALATVRSDVQFSFRHYPLDRSCNPVAAGTRHPDACRAALLVEAAGIIAGSEVFWQMHDWLLDQQQPITEELIERAATDLRLNAAALQATMEHPQLSQNIANDARAGKTLGLERVPMILIDGKHVPRWRLPGQRVLERIVDEASNTP
jgi:protein-disulfide isomerase